MSDETVYAVLNRNSLLDSVENLEAIASLHRHRQDYWEAYRALRRALEETETLAVDSQQKMPSDLKEVHDANILAVRKAQDDLAHAQFSAQEWRRARNDLVVQRDAETERAAAALKACESLRKEVAAIRAAANEEEAELNELREWKQALPQSHWFIERQQLQEKVAEQTTHLEAVHKDLTAIIAKRNALQAEVTEANSEAARQRQNCECAEQSLRVTNHAMEKCEQQRLALEDRLGIDAGHPDGRDHQGVREQNNQLIQAILGLHRAEYAPDHHPAGLQVIDDAWQVAWQVLAAHGIQAPNYTVPVKSEAIKAPVVKRASRSTRTKKPKV